jgi:hypothetical protein
MFEDFGFDALVRIHGLLRIQIHVRF